MMMGIALKAVLLIYIVVNQDEVPLLL